MIGGHSPPEVFTQLPYRMLWLKTFDSILMPIPMSILLRGAHTALATIKDGGSVLVYCAKGRHRSVAMAAAILISVGYTAHQAMGLIRTHRQAADPGAWHIQQRIKLFEKCLRNKISRPGGVGGLVETYSEFVAALVSNIILHSGFL